jgi:hypothetical protein
MDRALPGLVAVRREPYVGFVFRDVWGFIKARLATITEFVFAEEREPTGRWRGFARVIEVIANAVFLALLLVLAWRGVHAAWSAMQDAPVEQALWASIKRDWRAGLMLAFLALVAFAAVALVIEVLFRARAFAGPVRLLTAYAVYQVADVVYMIVVHWSETSWNEIIEALLE